MYFPKEATKEPKWDITTCHHSGLDGIAEVSTQDAQAAAGEDIVDGKD